MSRERPRHEARGSLALQTGADSGSGDLARRRLRSPGSLSSEATLLPRKVRETGHPCPLLVIVGLRQDSVQESLRRKDSDFVVTCRGRGWTHWPRRPSWARCARC